MQRESCRRPPQVSEISGLVILPLRTALVSACLASCFFLPVQKFGHCENAKRAALIHLFAIGPHIISATLALLLAINGLVFEHFIVICFSSFLVGSAGFFPH